VLSNTRDVHVNLPHFWAGTEVVWQYCPPIAVAIASLASGRLPRPDVAVVGSVDIADTFSLTVPAVTEPSHVLNLAAQGFRQLVVPARAAVADDMMGLLREANIEVWVDEDPLATFSSALPNIFGMPESDGPSEEQEADTVCGQDIIYIIPSVVTS
jgi:hypothetical protein